MALRAAEDYRSGSRVHPPRCPESGHAITVLDALFKNTRIKTSVPPWDLLKIHVVLKPHIVERDKRTLGDSIAYRCLPCENIIEETGNIDSITPLRGRGQSQYEGSIQHGKHLPIARRLGMVHLVNDP